MSDCDAEKIYEDKIHPTARTYAAAKEILLRKYITRTQQERILLLFQSACLSDYYRDNPDLNQFQAFSKEIKYLRCYYKHLGKAFGLNDQSLRSQLLNFVDVRGDLASRLSELELESTEQVIEAVVTKLSTKPSSAGRISAFMNTIDERDAEELYPPEA